MFSGQTLNVVENYDVLRVETEALGNGMTGGNDQVDARLRSTQSLEGDVTATATVNGLADPEAYRTSLGTPLYIATQAAGNYSAFTSQQGDLDSVTSQVVRNGTGQPHVYADTTVNAPNNSIYSSGEIQTLTVANHMAFEVTQGRLVSTATQDSNADSRARTGVVLHYSPSPNLYRSDAKNNYYSSYSDDRGSQEHAVTQTVDGRTEAYVSANAGNAWHIATQAIATANEITLYNRGGSLVTDTDQTNEGRVQSMSVLTSYEYGQAHSDAVATGNLLSAGNSDKYINIDLNQFNSGPIDATASFEGHNGYDVYVSADAAGNSSMAYGCAECESDMTVRGNQVNDASVTATTDIHITGSGRAIVSSARAVGNTATYFVSGGHNRP